MLGQILAIAAALGLTFLLLQLRRLIGGRRRDNQHTYRAYLADFDKTDWDFDEDHNLKIWPSELDLQPTTSSRQQFTLIDGQTTPTTRSKRHQ